MHFLLSWWLPNKSLFLWMLKMNCTLALVWDIGGESVSNWECRSDFCVREYTAMCLYGLVLGTAEQDKHRRRWHLGKPMSNRLGLVKMEIDAHCVDDKRGRVRTAVTSSSGIANHSCSPSQPFFITTPAPSKESLFTLSVAGHLY